MVANSGQVLDAAAADEHDRVLLQVVPLTGDVRRDFHPVRQPDAGDLAQCRVRLLRRLRPCSRAGRRPRFCGQDFRAGHPVL